MERSAGGPRCGHGGNHRRLKGENGYIESFNSKLRDELLNPELFDTLLEARVLVARWRRYYNELRPHSALGYRPPAPAAWMIGDQQPGFSLWGPTGEMTEGRTEALPYPYGHLPGAQVAPLQPSLSRPPVFAKNPSAPRTDHQSAQIEEFSPTSWRFGVRIAFLGGTTCPLY
jgi:hypothetical protein